MCSSSCQEKSHFIIHYERLKQYLLLLYLLSLSSAIFLQVLSRVQQYWVSMGASVESERCTVKCLHFLSSKSVKLGELVANFVAAEQLWLPPLWQWKDSGDPLPSEERRRVQDPHWRCPQCRLHYMVWNLVCSPLVPVSPISNHLGSENSECSAKSAPLAGLPGCWPRHKGLDSDNLKPII